MNKYLEKVKRNWKKEREKKDIYVKKIYTKRPKSIGQLNKIYFEKKR